MSANKSSAINALGNNPSATTIPSPLLRLPNELIEAVAEKLNKPADLTSMRSTCHHLRNGSAMTFSKLCSNPRTEIPGTGSIRHTTNMLLSPNLLGAQHLARDLMRAHLESVTIGPWVSLISAKACRPARKTSHVSSQPCRI